MSGMRNSPPISMSSPRETMTSLPARQGLQRQQHRRGAVVHHQRALGAGEPPEQRVHVRIPGAALLLRDVHLEVGIAARHHAQPLERQRREERAAQVGVQHHPGGIDHARREKAPARVSPPAPRARARRRLGRQGPRRATAAGGDQALALARSASRTAFTRRARQLRERRIALQRGEHRVHRGQARGAAPQGRDGRRARRLPTRGKPVSTRSFTRAITSLASRRSASGLTPSGLWRSSRRTASSVRPAQSSSRSLGEKP